VPGVGSPLTTLLQNLVGNGLDGREVLAEIKTDEGLRSIPVVVLTTSSAEEDILRSYNTYANAYVTKPVDLLRFMDVVRQIDDFFVTVVQHPW
jgi:CheY-like chemotaxis protein